MEDNERRPLLKTDSVTPTAPPPVEDPPPYMEEPSFPQPYNESQYPVPSVNSAPYPPPDSRAPPPYTNVPLGQTLFVQCRVCQHVINVPQGTNSRVVKCNSCNEATPISSPPPGKKYVRCPCNCLLTCSVTATRVVCPRANCKRTIGVGTITARQSVNFDRVRVTCGHCRRSILWPANATVARCPHCRGRSYIHYQWMRNRAIFCITLGIIFLIIGSIVTGVTLGVAMTIGGIYVISVGFFVSGIALIIRGIIYCLMTRSEREI